MKKFSANFIFPIHSAPVSNGVLVTDDHGIVVDLLQSDEGLEDVLKLNGFLCPGFVNAHCHLELSHLSGLLPEKEGLINFLSPIIDLRQADEDVMLEAMTGAEAEMKENGIVAVGDICNTADSFALKAKGNLSYHNFIEVFALDPVKANAVFSKGLTLYKKSSDMGFKSSMVPHAPYTESAELLGMLGDHAREHGNPVCIHNQESGYENALFRDASGPFREFYRSLGNDLAFFTAPGTNSLEFVVKGLGREIPLMLVHNTFTAGHDIERALQFNSGISFCLCPNANRYIENKLPDFSLFAGSGRPVMLGTDSLASNRRLSILDEMKRIVEHDRMIDLATMLTWATANGADFLGMQDQFGTFEKGKQPGINLICDVDLENMVLKPDSRVRVLS